MPEAVPFLDIEDLVAGYRPGVPIVDRVSLELAAGEIVCIIGPNGAGKSTLVKAVAGLVTIEEGRIRICGRDIAGTPPERIGDLGLAYVPQTANVFTTLTVRENLVLAARRCRSDATARIAEVSRLFPVLQAKRADRAAGLSGGERQLLALAMALIGRPAGILLDEPTAGLSPLAAADVLKVIGDIAGKGVAVLLVEQNARLALGLSDRAYILADGRNQHDGPARTMLEDPRVAEIYLGGKPVGAA